MSATAFDALLLMDQLPVAPTVGGDDRVRPETHHRFMGNVALKRSSNPGNAALGGTTTVAAVQRVAIPAHRQWDYFPCPDGRHRGSTGWHRARNPLLSPGPLVRRRSYVVAKKTTLVPPYEGGIRGVLGRGTPVRPGLEYPPPCPPFVRGGVLGSRASIRICGAVQPAILALWRIIEKIWHAALTVSQ